MGGLIGIDQIGLTGSDFKYDFSCANVYERWEPRLTSHWAMEVIEIIAPCYKFDCECKSI